MTAIDALRESVANTLNAAHLFVTDWDEDDGKDAESKSECAVLMAEYETAAPIILGAVDTLEALKILRKQFGDYKDGDGAAKFHACAIADRAIAASEGKTEGETEGKTEGKISLAIIVDGGLVQGVVCDDPAAASLLIEVAVVDYDTDDSNPDNLTAIDQGTGKTINAYCAVLDLDMAGIDLDTVFSRETAA